MITHFADGSISDATEAEGWELNLEVRQPTCKTETSTTRALEITPPSQRQPRFTNENNENDLSWKKAKNGAAE